MQDSPSPQDRDPRTPDPARTFVFGHKVFAAPNAHFKLDEQTGEPVFSVDLGDLKAMLGFETLRRSFAIAPASPDDRLLEAVARGLRFVRRIRPGDAIPAELLDGSASWKAEAHHAARAKARLASAGLAADKLEFLAEELAYIEALRERVSLARGLVENLRRLRGDYKRERAKRDLIELAVRLLERPVAGYESRLAKVDAGAATGAAAAFDRLIDLARDTRDYLHAETMRWDDLLAAWAHPETSRSPAEERKIAAASRFAARHFPATSEWTPA
ncbi:MAG: hypothetical protein ACKO1J_19625 [Tagaea sp.]